MHLTASTTQLLLAAIAGGGLTGFVSVITRRAEFRREDHARWLTERRDAYVGYLAVTDRFYRAAFRLLFLASSDRPAKNKAADLAETQSAYEAAQPVVDTLELLAPARVVASLREVEKVIQEIRLATAVTPAQPVADLPAALYKVREDFRREARRDLKLSNSYWHLRLP